MDLGKWNFVKNLNWIFQYLNYKLSLHAAKFNLSPIAFFYVEIGVILSDHTFTSEKLCEKQLV